MAPRKKALVDGFTSVLKDLDVSPSKYDITVGPDFVDIYWKGTALSYFIGGTVLRALLSQADQNEASLLGICQVEGEGLQVSFIV